MTLFYQDRARFLAGNRVFNANWVPAPKSYNEFRDGLGPLFDARSCAVCHLNNGRGRPPSSEGGRPDTMVMRISLRSSATEAEPVPHPRYGGQFNYRAVPGARPEGRVTVSYEELTGRFADGESYSIRMPHYAFSDLAFGPLGEDTLVSPRVAPPVIGLGLVEAVEEETILAAADPDDADGDGISGRANFIPDPVDGEIKLGRCAAHERPSPWTLRSMALCAANCCTEMMTAAISADVESKPPILTRERTWALIYCNGAWQSPCRTRQWSTRRWKRSPTPGNSGTGQAVDSATGRRLRYRGLSALIPGGS